ncbi:manganese efflux pump MntP family protein [Alteribacillus sp. HJP-4]|uniref:manganese efflux pump MntP n=1 Tax=Alteribacillus sp. HJP-4 TaxID=2775394 RepID=UPI0035CCF760
MGGWIILSTMALALSMDAFSMSLAVAMKGARVRYVRTACVVGLFHMLMPCIGLYGGRWIASSYEKLALFAGGTLLLLVGLQMVWAGLSKDENAEVAIIPRGAGLYLFALLVSIDSFSIGITLGILQAGLLKVLLVFGLVSAFFTWFGLKVGSRFQSIFGRYSEMLGGVILLCFGIRLML